MTKRVVELIPNVCSEEDLKPVEREYYKCNAYQNLILLASEDGKDTSKFMEEYFKAYAKCEEAKSTFERTFLLPYETENSKTWELDFVNGSVIFNEYDAED